MFCFRTSTSVKMAMGSLSYGTAMRRAHPNCIAILLTGYPAFETAVQAIEDEVDGYLVKPADINSLVSTIERKLSSRK